jgi:hypothetical protein
MCWAGGGAINRMDCGVGGGRTNGGRGEAGARSKKKWILIIPVKVKDKSQFMKAITL